MAHELFAGGLVKNCEVQLTPSKSISNRVLMIRALSGKDFRIENLSSSTDTAVLQKSLQDLPEVIDVKDAGTAFRFLTSYLAVQDKKFTLTGSERMKQRPVGPLVDSLRELGAEIVYSDRSGFPPLEITGRKIEGGDVSINSSVSSQFISSLMMLGPVLKNGLTIQLKGSNTSEPYIELTENIMKHFHADVRREDGFITILPKKYVAENFAIENDWSSASYWYLLCALNPGSEFILHGLYRNSFQGDRIIATIMSSFGVKTVYDSEKIIISSEYRKLSESISEFEFDFHSYPDLVMTMAVLCAAKGVIGKFTGVSSLRIKESDRLEVLKTELQKCGVDVSTDNDVIEIKSGGLFRQPGVIVTHNDHRIAMAFAPLATVLKSISFDTIDCVSKSYPEFWDHFSQAGLKFKD